MTCQGVCRHAGCAFGRKCCDLAHLTPCACPRAQITNWSRRVYMGPARPRPPTEDRCMEPQHLARPDDDGSVGAPHTGPAGGSTAVSPEGPEVPVPAPALDAWPL